MLSAHDSTSDLTQCCGSDDQIEPQLEDESERSLWICMSYGCESSWGWVLQGIETYLKEVGVGLFPSFSCSILTRMAGVGGWRGGSRYRTAAASSTPFSSQGYNNQPEAAGKPQQQMTSGEEEGHQASAYHQQQEQQ